MTPTREEVEKLIERLHALDNRYFTNDLGSTAANALTALLAENERLRKIMLDDPQEGGTERLARLKAPMEGTEPVAWYFKVHSRVFLTTCPEDAGDCEGKLPDWQPLHTAAQLNAVIAERDELWKHWKSSSELHHQIAASQAREKKLRDAVVEIFSDTNPFRFEGYWVAPSEDETLVRVEDELLVGLLEALALPTDDTALREYLEKATAAVEAERDELGLAICNAAVKSGIIRGDVSLTGPQLIMLCSDLSLASTQAKRDALKKDAEIGAAINRACKELPEGYDLHIELERNAGTVRLYLPDTDADLSDFHSDESFAATINQAIDAAMKKGD